MQRTTRTAPKVRHADHGTSRTPRPAPRRQGTRAAQIRAALREA